MSYDFTELRDLCDAVFDGRADQQQYDRLEALAMASPAARRFYLEYSQQHAALSWASFHPQQLQLEAPSGVMSVITDVPAPAPSRRSRTLLNWTVITAAIIVGLIGWWPRDEQPATSFATLERLQSAKWASSSLPTGEGVRLGPGRMELSDGLATIDFDKGVKLVLEAPAIFELLGPNECQLHQGRLRAEVRPGGEGFVVHTPTAKLVDRGTVFGVHVQVGGVSDVIVFKGQVDAEHHGTGKTVSATTGNGYRLTTAALEVIPDENAPLNLPGGPVASTSTQDSIQISTAIGRGMDAYIQTIVPPADRRSDTLLLSKRNNRRYGGERFFDWHRKIYLRFDLSLLGSQPVETARLELHADRSGMGFASHCPTATFSVYGLTDESLDDWGDEKLQWHDAPGNFPDGHSMDAARTVLLGQFVIPQGQCTGTFGIATPELAQFLKTDTNGLATVVIVRETIGTGVSDIVHAFASRRHPTLPAPMLRLTTPSMPGRFLAADSAE